MERHFARIRPCGKIVDIDLTDEVKEYVLRYRIWHESPKNTKNKEDCKPAINTTINNYNMINNFVSSIDPFEKLVKYMNYTQTDTVNLEEEVESRYKNVVTRMEANQYKYGYKLDKLDFLNIIDQASGSCNGNIEKINLLYDEKLNKLRYYSADDWQTFLIESGLCNLLHIIKEHYLDAYEVFLAKKIYCGTNISQANDCRQALDDYYSFIISFNIQPYIKDKTDGELLENTYDNSISISKKCMTIFKEVSDKLSQVEKNRVKKEVIDIIKRNSKSNIGELNKKLVNLFHMNEDFKKLFIDA